MRKFVGILLISVLVCIFLSACKSSSETSVSDESTANIVNTTTSNMTLEGIETTVAKYVKERFPDGSFKYSIGNWDDAIQRQYVEVIVTTEYMSYIYRCTLDCELFWSEDGEKWVIDRSKIINEEYDFSPLKGTWNAVYVHPSNYLTENNIPYTFTFSNAETISIKNGNASSATVKMDHELNQIWKKYANPDFSDVMPENGMNYESGTVEIACKNAEFHPHFIISFRETNADKMFDGECQLRIEENQIIFYDALVAKACKLKK